MTGIEKKCRKIWGQIIHERDRWCVICGATGDRNEAHHLFGRQKADIVTYDPDFGVLLCKEHHDMALNKNNKDFWWLLMPRLFILDEPRALRIHTERNLYRPPKSGRITNWKQQYADLTEILKNTVENAWMTSDVEPEYGKALL